MANIYVRSGASGANNGTSWANAYTTLVGASATWTNADTVWVAEDHAESQATAMTVNFPSSPGMRLYCAADHVTEPPTALATTATVSIGAGSVAMSLNGYAYVYGIKFQGGTNNSASCVINVATSTTIGHGMRFVNCGFSLRSANASCTLNFGNQGNSANDEAFFDFDTCGVLFGSTSQAIKWGNGRVNWSGGGYIDASGSTPTTLFRFTAGAPSDLLIENADWSTEASTNLFDVSATCPSIAIMRNCKIPSGVAVSTGSQPGPGGVVVLMHNCDSGDTNYRLANARYAGTVVSETTIVRSGGASDGTTPMSWHMATSASAAFPSPPLASPERAIWNETVGSSVTATVHVVTDNVTLTDGEAWLEVIYPGNSGSTQGSVITDAKGLLASASNQTSSSETWTTTGLTTPVKQQLSVTFTPQEKGALLWRVYIAKASTSVYVDPKIELS